MADFVSPFNGSKFSALRWSFYLKIRLSLKNHQNLFEFDFRVRDVIVKAVFLNIEDDFLTQIDSLELISKFHSNDNASNAAQSATIVTLIICNVPCIGCIPW